MVDDVFIIVGRYPRSVLFIFSCHCFSRRRSQNGRRCFCNDRGLIPTFRDILFFHSIVFSILVFEHIILDVYSRDYYIKVIFTTLLLRPVWVTRGVRSNLKFVSPGFCARQHHRRSFHVERQGVGFAGNIKTYTYQVRSSTKQTSTSSSSTRQYG